MSFFIAECGVRTTCGSGWLKLAFWELYGCGEIFNAGHAEHAESFECGAWSAECGIKACPRKTLKSAKDEIFSAESAKDAERVAALIFAFLILNFVFSR